MTIIAHIYVKDFLKKLRQTERCILPIFCSKQSKTWAYIITGLDFFQINKMKTLKYTMNRIIEQNFYLINQNIRNGLLIMFHY